MFSGLWCCLLLDSFLTFRLIYSFCILLRRWDCWFLWNFTMLRFQVSTVASMKMTVIWNAVPCSLVEVYWYFRGAHCFLHRGYLVMVIVNSSETMINYQTTQFNIPEDSCFLCKVVATLHNPGGSVLYTDNCESRSFKWRCVVTIVTVFQLQAVWHYLCLCRENDEEVGLGEVDERVSMLAVVHLHVVHLPHQSVYTISSSARTFKIVLHLLTATWNELLVNWWVHSPCMIVCRYLTQKRIQ
jgi:hypothetical protein